MSSRNTGMDNVFTMLERVFREARHLGRIPAVGKFTIGPTHNLGKVKSDFCFEDYLDLSNSITYKFEEGYHKAVSSHLDWVKEEDLDLKSCFFDTMYFLSDDEIVGEEMNNHYDVLIRRDPSFKYARTHTRYEVDDISIGFRYSERVDTLTDKVLDVLGTSRTHATAAQHYFSSRFNSADWCDSTMADVLEPNTNYYACMHVRMSDRESQWPVFEFSSSKEHIKSVLEHSISKGSQLYIMSDIHQPDFFDFLKSDYRVYRYHDFPDLKRLVSEESGGKIDNVMLYLAEKNIMKHATVKILPPHKGPMVYHLNTVYDLTLLKNPPRKRLRPTEFQKFWRDGMEKLSPKRLFNRTFIG